MKNELDNLEFQGDFKVWSREYADEWYENDLESAQRLGTERAKRIANIAARETQKPLNEIRFLDLGCNRGRYVIDFRKAGIKAFGIDINAYALKTAYPEVKKFLYLLDITNLDIFPDQSFDILYTNAINELAEEDRLNFFLELHRLITPTGFIMISFIEKELYDYWMKESQGKMKRSGFSFFKNGAYLDRSSFMRLIASSGFDLWFEPELDKILNHELDDREDFKWYILRPEKAIK